MSFSALSLSWNIRQLGVFSMTYPWFLEGWESTAEFWNFSNQNRQKQLRPKERDIRPWKPTCPLKRGPFQKESRRLPTITFQGRAVSFRSWDGFSAMVISSNIFSWQVSTWTEEPYGLLSRNTHCNFAEFWFIPIHDNAYKASNTQEKMMQLLSCSSLFMQKKTFKNTTPSCFFLGEKRLHQFNRHLVWGRYLQTTDFLARSLTTSASPLAKVIERSGAHTWSYLSNSQYLTLKHPHWSLVGSIPSISGPVSPTGHCSLGCGPTSQARGTWR